MINLEIAIKEKINSFEKNKKLLSKEKMKTLVKKDLIRAGILDKNGKIKELPIG